MSESLRDEVKRAVIWRSGSQILAQAVAWGSTLAVIRILDPSDYGLFAMTQVVLAFLAFLNGSGFASSLIQDRHIDETKVRQGFGLLILVNGGIALIQLAIAPIAAAWYRQPLVEDLLQVQALMYLATPFIAIPEVLLTRELDFRRPAIANTIATIVSAAVAITCALAGFGVWTLVYAPIAMFWTRAIALMVASRFTLLPSFSFAGAGQMFNFGIMLLASHFFWTIITQADVFIASRSVEPHDLGIYAEGLFLTTLIANKFVPPLNEVAFPAYAKLQNDRATLSASFLKAVRLIMLVTCPLYFGLAAVAPDAVLILLGEKWTEMTPLVRILSLAMPAMTLHILFAPAVNAIGRPEISMRTSLFGVLVMPLAFVIGVRSGIEGLAWAWLLAFPLLPAFAFLLARKPLGIGARQLLAALAPGIGAAAAMALPVHALGTALPEMASWARLICQIAAGGILYGAILFVTSRATLEELIALVLRRRSPEISATA
ncbi:O-antigen/teichoic acid export membrane protein [Altererythrobacter atlanticus]|uniref:Lipopolysaccharide biosynthesis protein WzxC n=1 Tax=Croceibacterium atlanticum TaxID=1267766 RepID=A0A0F7KYU3_9SPHN|nr:lipopolysaccharide biosynthesis protein [Croceibacterium atlanticum]AKH43990.1 Lipopolysaccharide biosynthesis protein WzxC [Croceibacterium atlanticum]MBB5732296.1 O-antigen/teichoic acid export membrane protein [Croceibacterium atlanticum]